MTSIIGEITKKKRAQGGNKWWVVDGGHGVRIVQAVRRKVSRGEGKKERRRRRTIAEEYLTSRIVIKRAGCKAGRCRSRRDP